MLSQRVRQSLNALVQMTPYYNVRQVTAAEFAGWAGATTRNIEKALIELRRDGLLASIRGANGGYVFGRDPATITFADVVKALDGPIKLSPCSGAANQAPCLGCVSPATCIAHPSLVEARKALTDVLNAWTLTTAWESHRASLGSPRASHAVEQ